MFMLPLFVYNNNSDYLNWITNSSIIPGSDLEAVDITWSVLAVSLSALLKREMKLIMIMTIILMFV